MNKNQRGLSRRQFLQGSAVLAAYAAVARGRALRAFAQDPIELYLLMPDWGGQYNELMELLGVQFNEANPNISVAWEHNSDAHAKFLTLIGGGTPPDMVMTYEANALAKLGALLPLDSYLADAGLTRDDFTGPLWDAGLLDGVQHIIPGGQDYLVMVYSKDVYRDAGLDADNPPKTTAEFMEANRAILRKDSSGFVSRIPYIPTPGHFVQWSHIFGGSWYDAENEKITANDPAIVASLEWLVDYVNEVGYDQYAQFTQLPGVFESGNPFSTGELAHFIEGFWVYDPLDQHAPEVDYGMMMLPTLNGTEEERANYTTGGWNFGIPTGAAHPDEAWQFLKFALVDNAAKMGVDTLNSPAYQPALPDWEAGLIEALGPDNRMVPYVSLFGEVARDAQKAFPALPVSAYYTDERDRAFEAALIGEKTPQAALDEVTANVQAELDRALSEG
jgi:multiple sugar transport system substrate-binding protein